MKKIVVLLVFILFATKSFAQLEIYAQFNQSGKVVPDINLYGEKKLTSRLNLSYFTLIEQKWAEALVGVNYYPTTWFNIGVMTGIEQNPALYRFYGSVWLGKDKTSLLLLFEKGHGIDNYWYKNTLAYKTTDDFTFGIRHWRYNGLGPIGIYSVKTSGLDFWTMPCYDFEVKQKRILVGIDIKL